jgi:ribosome-binding protein aMBF1 (putative translation factor)
MSAHMREPNTDSHKFFYVKVEIPNSKVISYSFPLSHQKEIKDFLNKQHEEEDDDSPVAWEVLAKERIEKYKKSGLVLRGMRYREGFSQKKLAKESGVSQNEISNIENGKRTVGKKIAEKLSNALNFDYRLLLDE